MNRGPLVVFVLSMLSTATAPAVEEHHPPPSSSTSPGPAATSALPASQAFERAQSLLQQARQTQDPAKRRALLREHMREVRQALQPPGAVPSGAGGQGMAMNCMDMMQMNMMQGMGMRHQQMESRIDTLQRAVEQLLEQQSLMLE